MPNTKEDQNSIFKLARLRCAFESELDVKFIEKILTTQGDINYKISNSNEYAGYTALHFLSQKRSRKSQNPEVIQLLFKYGADFTIKNDEERTALHEAIHLKENDIHHSIDLYTDIWKLFSHIAGAILSAHVEKSISENPGNKYGLTHLHVACMADHSAAVEMFLKNGVLVDLAVNEDSPLFPGCTPLHIAAKSCAMEVVKVLLKYGANPYAKDKEKMTAMHWLIECNRKIVDSLIIEHLIVSPETWSSKLKRNQQIIGLLLNSNKLNCSIATDAVGLSNFHVACTIEDVSVVEKLLGQVEYIDHQIGAESYLWSGYTALHFAAYFDLDTVKLLLSKGANVMIENTNGCTPFDICLERYTVKDIHSIMSTQPNWRSITLLDGKTKLLDLVSAMQDIDQFRVFLNEHIDNVNTSVSKDSALWPGYTPLHLAVIFSEQNKNRSNYIYIIPFTKFESSLDLVEECLSRGADVTAEDPFGCTPLHLAFRYQQTDTIKMLLQYHYSTVNPIDKYNVSHLHIACASGNKDVVEKLLQSGAKYDLPVLSNFMFYCRESRSYLLDVKRITAGSTPLHIAVVVGNSEIAQLFVDSGANVNAMDENGVTPIHRLFAEKTQPWLTRTKDDTNKILLSANLMEVIVNGAGISHLHVASFFGDVDAVKRLLDLGADIDARLGCESALNDFYDYYDNRKFEGSQFSKFFAKSTALDIAVEQERSDVVKLLLDCGADFLAKSAHGQYPLSRLISDAQNDCVRFFTQLFIENDALAKRVEEDYGLTAIHLASFELNPVAVKKLIDNGVNVNAQMNEKMFYRAGYTPLHMVIVRFDSADYFKDEDFTVNEDFIRNLLETTRLLLAAGADVTLSNADGNTPVHLIANEYTDRHSSIDLLKLMVDSIKYFHVNPVGRLGISHFHIACLLNNTMVIKKFLKHGVDINAAVNFFDNHQAGCSALHLIAREIFPDTVPPGIETIDVLLEHGADVNIQNAEGDTVLHTFARFAPDRVDIFQRLIRAGADLNKLNIFCDTPFTTLLLSNKATPEGLKLFIEHGCFINDFNCADQQGCLSHPLCVWGSQGRDNVFETLFRNRDITKSDATGRTAIHNIVSASGFDLSKDVSVEEYNSLIRRLCNRGCDIDSQDQSGRTALHFAARFKNNKAIAALLINGADVNIVDNCGNTAFTYSLKSCGCKKSENRHRHDKVIKTFYINVKILKRLKLSVNEINRNMVLKADLVCGFNETDRMERFAEEINQIRAFKFEEDSTSFILNDILSDSGVVGVYPLKASVRVLVDKFFRKIDLYLSDYSGAIGILKLQFRKAVKRIALVEPATKSLKQLVGFSVPEICCQIVLRFFSNSDLETLIFATNPSEMSHMIRVDMIRSHD